MKTATTKAALALAAMTVGVSMLTTGCSVNETKTGDTASSAASSSPASTAPKSSSSHHASPESGQKAKNNRHARSVPSTSPKQDKTTGPPRNESSAPPEKTPATAPPATPPKTQTSILKKFPGSTKSSTCVTVGSRHDVTSGTVAMGNFQTAAKLYKAQVKKSQTPLVSLYVIPTHRSMPGVQITMTPVNAKGKSRTINSKEIEPADIWQYYSVHLPISSPGSWRLKVSSGSDSGCFDVTFHK